MKDLYKRIGLYRSTDNLIIIRQAVEYTSRTSPEIAKEASYVLLNPARKSTYDRTRIVLVQIGHIRANLDLYEAENWQIADCNDFQYDNITKQKCLPRLQFSKTNKPSNKIPSLGSLLAIFVIVLVVGCCLSVLFYQTMLGFSKRPVVVPEITSSPGRGHLDTAPTQYREEAPYAVSRSDAVLEAIERRRRKQEEDALNQRNVRVREFVLRRTTSDGLVLSSEEVDRAVEKILTRSTESLPNVGVLNKAFRNGGVAPLEIRTSSGSIYYIKVVKFGTNIEVLTAFVVGGEPFKVDLPLGRYEIRYSAGQDWYGPVFLMGPDGSYQRCDSEFIFSETSTAYSGYIIELVPQMFGNLDTEAISPGDF